MNDPRRYAKSHNPYNWAMMQIHAVEDQEQNPYHIGIYCFTTDISDLRTTCQTPSSIKANFPIDFILYQLYKEFRKLGTQSTRRNNTTVISPLGRQ
jgi:hypothetical protein